jgi:hypothetical protein
MANPKSATLGLRTIHGQAVEAVFALLFALLQAPTAPVAWLLLYQPRDLRVLVKKVAAGAQFPCRFALGDWTWRGVAAALMPCQDDPAGDEAIEKFSSFWARLANDFRHPRAIHEYNSLKHGLRARPASPVFAIGGYQLTSAEHGSWFPVVNNRGSDVLVGIGCRSWSAGSLLAELKLIAASIKNVVAIQKLIHGIGDAGRVELEVPSEEEVLAARPPTTQQLASFALSTDWSDGWKPRTLDRMLALQEFDGLGSIRVHLSDVETTK